jgi:TadE-like protein
MRQREQTGQGLVEFALVIPIFLLMLFGVVDAGRYVYMNSILSQAAREGARLAAVEASWIGLTASDDPACVVPPAVITSVNPGAHICPRDNGSDLRADALVAANRMVAPFGSISSASFYMSCDPAGSAPTGAWTSGTACSAANVAPGDIVSVRVLLTFTPLTPVIAQIMGTITTSGSATMVMN